MDGRREVWIIRKQISIGLITRRMELTQSENTDVVFKKMEMEATSGKSTLN